MSTLCSGVNFENICSAQSSWGYGNHTTRRKALTFRPILDDHPRPPSTRGVRGEIDLAREVEENRRTKRLARTGDDDDDR